MLEILSLAFTAGIVAMWMLGIVYSATYLTKNLHFSLRTLFIAMTAVAVVIGLFSAVYQWRK